MLTILVVLFAWPLAVLWAIVKRPVLAIPAVLLVGVVVLIGGMTHRRCCCGHCCSWACGGWWTSAP